jgi:hypothetical protein
MAEGAGQLTCDEFQRQLCRLLAADEPIEVHPHYKRCMLCRCLVRTFDNMIENTLGERFGNHDRATDDWPEST